MPSHVSRCRAHNVVSPSLHRVQEGLFPRFNETMRASDSPPPLSPRFVAFAWRYHRRVGCLLPSVADAPLGAPGS